MFSVISKHGSVFASDTTTLPAVNTLYAALGMWLVCIVAPEQIAFETIESLLNIVMLSM